MGLNVPVMLFSSYFNGFRILSSTFFSFRRITILLLHKLLKFARIFSKKLFVLHSAFFTKLFMRFFFFSDKETVLAFLYFFAQMLKDLTKRITSVREKTLAIFQSLCNNNIEDCVWLAGYRGY